MTGIIKCFKFAIISARLTANYSSFLLSLVWYATETSTLKSRYGHITILFLLYMLLLLQVEIGGSRSMFHPSLRAFVTTVHFI